MGVFFGILNLQQIKMQIKDPLTITPEEDEEQMIMRRLRNSCDELKRGYNGWIIECRGSNRKLSNPEKIEKILNFRKRKFQFEENQSHSRPTFPWTKSSSTGRTRRQEGDV